jgi:hypothetical protein
MLRTEQANFVPAASALRPALRSSRARGFRRPGSNPRRRGIAALIAMLYLLIFSALALGFYSAVTMAAQLAHNDEKALGAQIAAESGLEFVTYELTRVRVPGTTPPNQMIQEVLNDLIAQQAASDNLDGRGIILVGDTIQFPAGANDFIALDDGGAGFRAEITDAGDGMLRVKVHARYRGVLITRAIELYFETITTSTKIFDFGIVTRGPIHLNGNPSVGGKGMVADDNSVLSLYEGSPALVMNGGPSIAGDVFMTNPRAGASVSGGASVGGSSISALRDEHIHSGEPHPEPELPTVDTSIFLPFVTSTYKPGLSVYRNVRIPANTNPKFSSDVTIEGVMYVEYPNQLSFSGKSTVRGVIVVQNGATAGTNSMKFTGQFQAYGIETLPATPDFPEDLRKLTGSSILAPGFDLDFGGGAGTVGGTLVANTFTFRGNSGGTVNGTLISLGTGPLSMNGNPALARIKPNGPVPAGLLFSKTFKPIPQTYSEVKP